MALNLSHRFAPRCGNTKKKKSHPNGEKLSRQKWVSGYDRTGDICTGKMMNYF